MGANESKTEQRPDAVPETPFDGAAGGEDANLSRLERLKRKLRKLQGKNPDIYPMW